MDDDCPSSSSSSGVSSLSSTSMDGMDFLAVAHAAQRQADAAAALHCQNYGFYSPVLARKPGPRVDSADLWELLCFRPESGVFLKQKEPLGKQSVAGLAWRSV